MLDVRTAREGDIENFLRELGWKADFHFEEVYDQCPGIREALPGHAVVATYQDRVVGIGGISKYENGEYHAWIETSRWFKVHAVLLVRVLRDGLAAVLADLGGEPLHVVMRPEDTRGQKLAGMLGFMQVGPNAAGDIVFSKVGD